MRDFRATFPRCWLFCWLFFCLCAIRAQSIEFLDSDELSNLKYKPCYPVPRTDLVDGAKVTITQCGDKFVGNQSIWWRAVEPEQQCFGASMPERRCSKSTTDEFHCLVGAEWDALRAEVGTPKRQRPTPVNVEMGNWLTSALTTIVARIVLEEMMGYRVAVVAREGTAGAFERASRHERYMTLEAWESTTYKLTSDYYVWGDVVPEPFITSSARGGAVVWAATGEAIPEQPESGELRQKTLDVRETELKRNLQGITGSQGIFVNGAALQRQIDDPTIIADYWRGHLQEKTLRIFTPDGTIKCRERLKTGQACTDADATFFCPSECPSPIWEGNACCIHGKFYPPQCIPEGVTYDDIRADPEWASPNCYEFIHGHATWDLAWFEAVIVNLKLNYTVTYLGNDKSIELITRRSINDIPTVFYYWRPDPLITLTNATEVILPFYDAEVPITTDPLTSPAAFVAPNVLLTKLINGRAQKDDGDLFRFFQNYYWLPQDVNNMMRMHKLGGGEMNVEEAACNWVQENRNKWIRWVSIEYQPSDDVSSGEVLVLSIILVSSTIVLIGAVVFFWRKKYGLQSDFEYLKWTDIVVNYPVIVLGQSPMGDIVAAKYRSMPVALKPMGSPKVENQSRFNDQSWISRQISNEVSSDDESEDNGDMWASPKNSEMNSIRVVSFDHKSGREVLTTITVDEKQLSHPDPKESMETPQEGHGLVASMPETTNAVGRTRNRRKRVSLWLEDKLNSISVISMQPWSSGELDAKLLQEMKMLSKIRNPYLISLYGLTIEPQTKTKYVVTEFMQDSLHELVHNPTVVLDQQVTLSIVKNIAAGMHYLHSMDPPVLHGNLCTANILMDDNLTAKVAEFGLAGYGRSHVFCTAPEILLGTVNGATKAQDVYSFGTLVYEVFTRKKPSDVYDPSDWLAAVGHGEYHPLEVPSWNCSHEALCNLVLKCQDLDPEQRPTFSDIDHVLQQIDITSISSLMHGLQCKKNLLDDILPAKVAEMLAQGKKVEPEHYDMVTIFFSDIVGFTTISSTQPPEKVMAMLDRLYGKFDDLTKKHGLFKVETIGDAYMAVGNLSQPQPDHAMRVARFAMDAVKAAQVTPISLEDPDLGTIQIRCGFHSGPVVASVVGTTNPRYCLFGDTVNVASRMESSSEANCIHLSEAASEAMSGHQEKGQEIPLLYRGCHNIKGKGDMRTFWVYGFHSQAFNLKHEKVSHTLSFKKSKSIRSNATGVSYGSRPTTGAGAKSFLVRNASAKTTKRVPSDHMSTSYSPIMRSFVDRGK